MAKVGECLLGWFYDGSGLLGHSGKDSERTLNITDWLDWFLSCLIRSIQWAKQALHDVIRKARVLRKMETLELNERQKKIMVKFLSGGFGEFVNATKYKNSADCSADTANRDLTRLADMDLLQRTGQGKSTAYVIK